MNTPEVRVCAEAWRAEGAALSERHHATQWDIADWLVTGFDSFPKGQVYDVAEGLFPEYSRTTLYTFATVARTFPKTFPRGKVSFSHYRAVLAISSSDVRYFCASPEAIAEARAEWLERAALNKWSVATLNDQIRHEAENWLASKGYDDAEGEAEAEAAEGRPRAGKLKAKADAEFTYTALAVGYQEKLAMLAAAQRTTVAQLTVRILEEYLDQQVEEISVIEERAKAEAARNMETKRAAEAAAPSPTKPDS
jgi:hypothetical protein